MTHNGFFLRRINNRSMIYAGMKWKNITLKICRIQLVLIDPSGYHNAKVNGVLCKCFLPVECHKVILF